MRAELSIELHRAGDGTVAATGDLAATPYWCRWDGTTLWIVSSAATPVGDDDITFDLTVGEGVTAVVRTVAATVVYAARGDGTRLTTRLHIGSGASLVWQPEPVIVTARARHRSRLEADVASGGTLVADELVSFGRSNEDAGRFASMTDLRRDGATISLTSFDTATPGWSGPGGTAGAKVVGTRVVVDACGHDTSWANDDGNGNGVGRVDATTAVLRPAGGGTLITALSATPDGARASLARAAPTPAPPARLTSPTSR